MPDQSPGEYWGEDYLAQAERLYIAGDHRRAFSKAVQSIESNPLRWSAYMLAGRCLEMLDKDYIRRNTEFIQDEDTPEDYYQSALIHAPGDAERASALVELGRLPEERRAYSEALKHFEMATIFRPEWSTTWYGLAYNRSIVSGELDAVSLREAFKDAEAVALAQNDLTMAASEPEAITRCGTPESMIRAGHLGLPVALAIIGGDPSRFTVLANQRLIPTFSEEPRDAPPNAGVFFFTTQNRIRSVAVVTWVRVRH